MKVEDLDFRIWCSNNNTFLKERMMRQENKEAQEIKISAVGILDFYEEGIGVGQVVEYKNYEGAVSTGFGFSGKTATNYDIEFFTGVCDVEGKRIFENDVVGFWDYKQNSFVIDVVVFDKESGSYRTKGDNKLLCDYDKIELMGNIHENQDMIVNTEQTSQTTQETDGNKESE